MTTVTLQSSDDQEFHVARNVAEMSITIRNLVEDTGNLDAPIHLPNVSGAVLAKVIAYCTHHAEHSASGSAEADDVTSAWDQAFCGAMGQTELFELVLAANYLDVAPLLHAACKTVAESIKGKSVEELRTIFQIENDFTPEEEERVRAENEWCME